MLFFPFIKILSTAYFFFFFLMFKQKISPQTLKIDGPDWDKTNEMNNRQRDKKNWKKVIRVRKRL